MEFIIIAILISMLIFVGVRKLFEKPQEPQTKNPHMVFMSEALKLVDHFGIVIVAKTEQRAIDIAKADNRFLITTDDMKQAYQEIIREEL